MIPPAIHLSSKHLSTCHLSPIYLSILSFITCLLYLSIIYLSIYLLIYHVSIIYLPMNHVSIIYLWSLSIYISLPLYLLGREIPRTRETAEKLQTKREAWPERAGAGEAEGQGGGWGQDAFEVHTRSLTPCTFPRTGLPLHSCWSFPTGPQLIPTRPGSKLSLLCSFLSSHSPRRGRGRLYWASRLQRGTTLLKCSDNPIIEQTHICSGSRNKKKEQYLCLTPCFSPAGQGPSLLPLPRGDHWGMFAVSHPCRHVSVYMTHTHVYVHAPTQVGVFTCMLYLSPVPTFPLRAYIEFLSATFHAGMLCGYFTLLPRLWAFGGITWTSDCADSHLCKHFCASMW